MPEHVSYIKSLCRVLLRGDYHTCPHTALEVDSRGVPARASPACAAGLHSHSDPALDLVVPVLVLPAAAAKAVLEAWVVFSATVRTDPVSTALSPTASKV